MSTLRLTARLQLSYNFAASKLEPMMDVKNLRVVITGAAAGAGRVVAETFADAGARVLACDIDEAAVAELAAARPDIRVERVNAGDEAQINRLFDGIERRDGGLDVLINNAGVAGPTAWAEDVTLAEWSRTFDVNVTGHFLCAKRAIRLMKIQRAGAIINVSSMSAKVGLPLRLPYAVSKAAVLSLTQGLAREAGPFNIRVNAILPGAIEGDRLRRVIAAKSQALGVSEADYEAQLLQYTSMRTTVSPRDIAAMAMFLASDAARRVSGQLIAVDGDLQYEA
jgi:NAD(P)-dependent dehydrogenase (short-subunit alcohol dehydrogenase family)